MPPKKKIVDRGGEDNKDKNKKDKNKNENEGELGTQMKQQKPKKVPSKRSSSSKQTATETKTEIQKVPTISEDQNTSEQKSPPYPPAPSNTSFIDASYLDDGRSTSSPLPPLSLSLPPSPSPSPPTFPSSASSPKMFDNFSRDEINKALTFHINNVDLGIVNALRRIITSELPNVAIEFDPYDPEKSDIRFIENTSSLHNEFLGHRISLLPIKLDEEEIENFQKQKYNFEIHIHNTTRDKVTVTTDDIRITDEYDEEKDRAFHEKVFPRSPITGDPIIIVVLNENNYNTDFGEKLHVKFSASIGCAKKHSRYSAVSTCAYYNVIDEEKANIAREAFVRERENEKVSAFITKQKKEGRSENAEEIKINADVHKKRFDVHDRFRYFKKNEYDEPSAFAFTIEPESRMSEKYIVSKSFDILIHKLRQIVDEKRYKITSLNNNKFSILLEGEQHTMGNLIQVMLYNRFVRGDERKLSFVGYYLVHPLVEEIILKMTFTEDTSIEQCDAFFKDALKGMEHNLDAIKNTWSENYVEI